MTNNLGTTRGSAGMSVDAAISAFNDAVGALDAALTEGSLQVAFVAGSPANTVTLTAAQFIGNIGFQAVAGSPGPSGACTLNVPATNAEATTLKRGFFAVINDLGVDLTVQKDGGQSETAPVLTSTQRSILYFDGSNVYLAVPQGAIGSDGVSAGIRWEFDTSTTTTADPGSGDVRFNNAAFASVTEIALSDNSSELGHPSVEAFLATWDDSTSATKGQVLIEKAAGPENFAAYAVTAGINEAGWWRFTVTHIASSGSFGAGDVLSVQFTPKGDQGAGSTVAIEEEGVSVNAAAATINFVGTAVTATDAGGGEVTVTISGGAAFSGALVKKSVDQTTANYTAATAIAWDAEEYDEGGWHDNVTNNSRLTVPSGVSKVRVYAIVFGQLNNADTYTVLDVRKNGAAFTGGSRIASEIGVNTIHLSVATPPLSVTPGDYFEAFLQVESDTSITVSASFGTSFAIEKVE